MTQSAEHWNERYITGDLPWDTGRPDGRLSEILDRYSISPCRAIDIGCGTGTNAIYLAGKGFDVTGVDISAAAVKAAEKKAVEAGVTANFRQMDILGQPDHITTDFVFDRGCFHSFDSHRQRSQYARNVHSILSENGLWLSIIGNTDGPPRDPGPPRRSAIDITTAVEFYFEILLLESSLFDTDTEDPIRSWICLMKRKSLLNLAP